MELIVDLILPPLFGFFIAKIVQRLPAKLQLFLGSIIIASIAAPLSWILFASAFKPHFDDMGQAMVGIPFLFIVILLLTFLGINHVRTRRKNTLTQDQFALASDLIRGYRFQKALDILAKVKHPQAREWEAILHDMIQHDPEFLQHLESI